MTWPPNSLRLNRWRRRRDERLRQYLETEEHEVMDIILRNRAERDETERQIDLELSREGREGGNRLINREMRMLPLTFAVSKEPDCRPRRNSETPRARMPGTPLGRAIVET